LSKQAARIGDIKKLVIGVMKGFVTTHFSIIIQGTKEFSFSHCMGECRMVTSPNGVEIKDSPLEGGDLDRRQPHPSELQAPQEVLGLDIHLREGDGH
jgi:hypothetical protein